MTKSEIYSEEMPDIWANKGGNFWKNPYDHNSFGFHTRILYDVQYTLSLLCIHVYVE